MTALYLAPVAALLLIGIAPAMCLIAELIGWAARSILRAVL